ncbi:MAG: HAD hydrolase-like protein [Actinomycetota bacterium]|nr:HAD hydrolase-like protein [Actinomycetota bacterium]
MSAFGAVSRDPLEVLVLDIGGTVVREGAGFLPDGTLVVELQPGVEKDLAELASRYTITAATNTSFMSAGEVRAYLDRGGVGHYFAEIVTSFDHRAPKPDPTIVVLAARAGGATAMDRVLFVGDAASDEEAARAAGVHFAFVAPDGLGATVARWLLERDK